jgi:hypothetical protein
MNDLLGANSHKVIENSAYQYWERRGRPLGSPEIDWFAAEKTLTSSWGNCQEIPLYSLAMEANEEPYR